MKIEQATTAEVLDALDDPHSSAKLLSTLVMAIIRANPDQSSETNLQRFNTAMKALLGGRDKMLTGSPGTLLALKWMADNYAKERGGVFLDLKTRLPKFHEFRKGNHRTQKELAEQAYEKFEDCSQPENLQNLFSKHKEGLLISTESKSDIPETLIQQAMDQIVPILRQFGIRVELPKD